MKKTTTILENILTLVAILFVLWGIVSFIEVNCHNREADYEYNKYNMFTIVTSIGDDTRGE